MEIVHDGSGVIISAISRTQFTPCVRNAIDWLWNELCNDVRSLPFVLCLQINIEDSINNKFETIIVITSFLEKKTKPRYLNKIMIKLVT